MVKHLKTIGMWLIYAANVTYFVDTIMFTSFSCYFHRITTIQGLLMEESKQSADKEHCMQNVECSVLLQSAEVWVQGKREPLSHSWERSALEQGSWERQPVAHWKGDHRGCESLLTASKISQKWSSPLRYTIWNLSWARRLEQLSTSLYILWS